MKNKIFILIISIAAIVLLSKCTKDFLDKSPQDSPTATNFFVNETSARQAVTAIIQNWSTYWLYGGGYMPTYLDICTDDAWLYGNRDNQPWRHAWTNLDFTPGYSAIGGDHMHYWWQFIYISINDASFAADYIPLSSDLTFTPEMQKKYIGVAKMMRAFAYINLTTLWGDVPLHKHLLTDAAESFVAASPKSEILQFAINDLVYATENVPNSWDGNSVGLPTKAAAAGFLAKAYLYAQKFDSAEIAAKNALDIADASGYGLMDDYAYMMAEASQPNKEFIFALEFIPNQTLNGVGAPLSNQGIVYRGVRDDPTFIQNLAIGGLGAGFGYAMPTRNLVDAFEPGDPRRKASMWLAGDYFNVIYHGPTILDKNPYTGKTTRFRDGDSVKYQNGWAPGNVNSRKMVSSVLGLSNVEKSGYDIPILRYAELYLYYAEALIENNKFNEGMIQLNKVRARPSVHMPALTATDQADARAKLRHERRIELNMEGIRIYDLLRWGIMQDIFGAGPDTHKILGMVGNDTIYKETNLVFPKNNHLPIPQEEIDLNKKLLQNTGY